jgi:palmitoyltransferase
MNVAHQSGAGVSKTWPPEDDVHPDEHFEFTLPSSPWTYENGSLNPELRPYNSQIRSSRSRKRHSFNKDNAVSNFPPYHPDYGKADGHSVSSGSVSSDPDLREPEVSGNGTASVQVRRGSEGYEVQSLDREEMLRRYIQGQVTEPGRYHVYAPEQDRESDGDLEENIPLEFQIQRGS